MDTDDTLADQLGLYVAAEPDDDAPWAVYDRDGARVLAGCRTREDAERQRRIIAGRRAEPRGG